MNENALDNWILSHGERPSYWYCRSCDLMHPPNVERIDMYQLPSAYKGIEGSYCTIESVAEAIADVDPTIIAEWLAGM